MHHHEIIARHVANARLSYQAYDVNHLCAVDTVIFKYAVKQSIHRNGFRRRGDDRGMLKNLWQCHQHVTE